MPRALPIGFIAAAGLALPFMVWVHAAQAPTIGGRGTVHIDLGAAPTPIPRNLYGIFFEEINHAGDGGLYGELIRNRGFEDANLPPACVRDGGFVAPPRTPHFDTGQPNNWRLRWDVDDPHPSWSLEATGGADASIDLTAETPLNDATPHSLALTITKPATGPGRVALINDGYWGIGVTSGASYALTLFARTESATAPPIIATLETVDGSALARQPLTPVAGAAAPSGWRKYSGTLSATATNPKARLALAIGGTGRVWLDMVSLFPTRTFKNRPNGLRADIAQMVADLKPGFIRGPGGCFAEGITIESRPQWKRSLGALETRPGTYSPWGYWSTDGFGFHEFLQFAEDVGADALWVVNVGVSCSFRSGTFLPDDQLPELIQDTLDAIEYAIGPRTTKWGALRAKAGHPEPFPLKYIEIGNEQQGAKYGERVARFYKAIKARYPQMKIALSSWIAGLDRRAIDAVGPIDIIDEHAYKALNWSIENFDSFASYKREGWDLYIGEFATNAGVGRGNWAAAIGDAAYMMSVEKNTDLVKMASYAPLLENVNHRDWEVNMIHFDSSRLFARATYYVQKLFADHLPSSSLRTTTEYAPASAKPITGRVGVGTWNTAAEFRDIKIERDGKIVYQSDFTTGARGWVPETGRGQGGRGTWSVADGAYRQSGNAVAFAYLDGSEAADTTITLKARKIAGAEGFLVFGGLIDDRRVQWNVAGWNNTQSAMQATDAIVGRPARGGIETGRWYDLRLEVRGRTVRGYLDGTLLNDATYPRVDTVLAIAGRDDTQGEVIIKALNTGPDPAAVTFELSSATSVAATGQLTVLSSPNPLDENSFEEPKKIVPTTSTISGLGKTFSRTLPPYSLSILRVRAR